MNATSIESRSNPSPRDPSARPRPSPASVSVLVLRWTARLASLVSIATLSLFILGELGTPTPMEWLKLALFPLGVMAGMMFAWRRPLVGGLFALGSLAAFYALALTMHGSVPGGPWFVIFTSPALLFVLVGAIARRAPSI